MRSPTFSNAPPAPTAVASGSSPTSHTGASGSTAWSSQAPPARTRGRSSTTAMGRCFWRPASGSATSPCRRCCPPRSARSCAAALMPLGLAIGWGFPDAIMQYAVPALETLSLDMAELTRKRDRMYGALTEADVDVTRPEGTFYLWGRAPGGDAQAFCDALAARGVYLMPGRLFDQPHHFRISLTATMATIDRALPHTRRRRAEPGRGGRHPLSVQRSDRAIRPGPDCTGITRTANSHPAPRFAGPKPARHPFSSYDAAASGVDKEESTCPPTTARPPRRSAASPTSSTG